MNNRDYKGFAKGEFYHVYNRGVGKMNVFLDVHDYKIFLSRLEEIVYPEKIDYSEKPKSYVRRKELPSNSYQFASYCLMPNHFHFLIKQNSDVEIFRLISKLCTGYSKYFNKKYDRVGPLFQDTFKAVRVSKHNQLSWIVNYIHKNPVKADLVKQDYQYEWSSAKEYSGMVSEDKCLCNKINLIKLSPKYNSSNYIQNSYILIDY